MDTSSILDLEAYGLTKRLRKIKIVIVHEVLNEIKDRNLKRRLVRFATDRGPQKRTVFIPNLHPLDYGAKAIITAMACDRIHRKRLCTYVSNDSATLEFLGAESNCICDGKMDTSEFIINLYNDGIVEMEDMQNVLSCSSRPPNKKCRERLECLIGGQ